MCNNPIAGWCSNSRYSLFGGVLAVAQTISYEVRLWGLSYDVLIEDFRLIEFYKCGGMWPPEITKCSHCQKKLKNVWRSSVDRSDGKSLDKKSGLSPSLIKTDKNVPYKAATALVEFWWGYSPVWYLYEITHFCGYVLDHWGFEISSSFLCFQVYTWKENLCIMNADRVGQICTLFTCESHSRSSRTSYLLSNMSYTYQKCHFV